MKSLNAVVLTAVVLAAGALASGSAFAWGGGHFHGGHFHGGHFHQSRVVVGIGVGVPVYWGSWYYPPAYYYPPYSYPYYSPPYYAYPPASSPPTYIERGDEQAAPAEQPSQWWYYCADAKAYYPYVKECPGGWQRVSPQPPPAR